MRRSDSHSIPASAPVHGWREWVVRFGREWAVVVAIATLALIGSAKVGEDVLAGESTGFDVAVQHWLLAHQSAPLVTFFLIVTRVGGIAPMTGLAVLGAANLWARGKRRVAAGVLVAPVVAIALFNIVKLLYARPRPVGLGGIVPSSYSFPSGHATASAAICCTLAYVYWREGLIRRSTAVTLAIAVPLIIGVSRVYLNVHWATDVIGGWCAGLLIAVLCTLLYDRNRRRPEALSAPATSPTHPTAK
ncbi:MAG: phosphatase PAP2 family protein [Gemmatimonadota bacterium]|nr:phosphatase PAP2 family protein [Gemmatimonadota bacterium]